MTRAEDRDLLRRLAGESAPGDAEQPLVALWAALEPPPVEPPPPGFAGRVMSRVEEQAARHRSGVGRLWAAPGRLAAASALSAGLLAGAGLGMLLTAADREVGSSAASAMAPDVPVEAAGREEEQELLAAAVEAVTDGGWASDPEAGLAASFGADPELAGGYLAALAALDEEPL